MHFGDRNIALLHLIAFLGMRVHTHTGRVDLIYTRLHSTTISSAINTE